MSAKRILVLGGGFAGLWCALGAAREREALGLGPDAIEITLVNRDAFHAIRVRNYEADLSEARVPLDAALGPAQVRRTEGTVTAIDPAARSVMVASAGEPRPLAYDRLVCALGSELARGDVPGLAEHAFDVDTYGAAERLERHLQNLPGQAPSPGRFTVLVVGAGLTGIEVATEMPSRLRALIARAASRETPRVILADRRPALGSDMGPHARPVIETALATLGIETRPRIAIASIGAEGATLTTGEAIAASTVIWCAGMRAHPLTALFPVERDRLGRLPVDACMRVKGLDGTFAAGDVAAAMMDEDHPSVMSCQHARPMGRFAGCNVVRDALGLPLMPLHIPHYVTILDLGAWGAVYTQGWERRVVSEGAAAKRTKQEINCRRIYPPLGKGREAILAAAAPVVQSAPALPA